MRGLKKYKKPIKAILFAVYISFAVAVCITVAGELFVSAIM